MDISRDGIRVAARGREDQLIPLKDITLVYTSLMPKRGDFQEVLAIEFSAPGGEGVVVMDPADGFDTSQAVQRLREALGERWDDIYVGHKHLSKVRVSP